MRSRTRTEEAIKASARCIDYDKDAGIFMWNGMARKLVQGKKAGTVYADGYLMISFLNVRFSAHRLAWFKAYGCVPDLLDHVNGNRLDNRIANLREATFSQNRMNSVINKNNTSGFRGVSRSRAGNWIVLLGIEGKQKYLGCYKTKEMASEVYEHACIDFFGEFACQR